ncbi:MAG: 4Fe-4S single cluster domain-containing protein [Coriobacteriales bacterium]|jgi:anaerobic ribonucleoside-triphosphate reductase activating protein
MYVDRILFPISSLGPGDRVALWVSGCSKHCKGCANPELWDQHDFQQVSLANCQEMLLGLHSDRDAHRLTLTGGDPLEQAGELLQLLEAIRPAYDDVLLYTGFTLDEVKTALSEEQWQSLHSSVDVLIDGPYINDLNDGCALRGSSNQHIYYLNPAVEMEYRDYLALGRSVQNIVYDGKAISVGIHDMEVIL